MCRSTCAPNLRMAFARLVGTATSMQPQTASRTEGSTDAVEGMSSQPSRQGELMTTVDGLQKTHQRRAHETAASVQLRWILGHVSKHEFQVRRFRLTWFRLGQSKRKSIPCLSQCTMFLLQFNGVRIIKMVLDRIRGTEGQWRAWILLEFDKRMTADTASCVSTS